MKRSGLLIAMLFTTATVSLSAQGPGRAALSSRPIEITAESRARIAVAHSGMTHSERGALIGAAVGIVAGAILSASYDEKKFSDMAVAGVIMAIPVSLIGAIIGLLMH